MILHIINLSGCNRIPGFIEEEYAIGPLDVRVQMDKLNITSAQLRVNGSSVPVTVKDGWAYITMAKIESHEMVVFT